MPGNDRKWLLGALAESIISVGKEAGLELLRDLRRILALGVAGAVLGGGAGSGAALIYGFPLLAAAGLGALAGLVIAVVVAALIFVAL